MTGLGHGCSYYVLRNTCYCQKSAVCLRIFRELLVIFGKSETRPAPIISALRAQGSQRDQSTKYHPTLSLSLDVYVTGNNPMCNRKSVIEH